jgi:hypothetical protein
LWCCPDSQEVGLEAAILERVRNSSLVEWRRADNVTGLKQGTEAADVLRGCSRRKAGRSRTQHMVGERSGVAEKRERERTWSEPKRECRNE